MSGWRVVSLPPGVRPGTPCTAVDAADPHPHLLTGRGCALTWSATRGIIRIMEAEGGEQPGPRLEVEGGAPAGVGASALLPGGGEGPAAGIGPGVAFRTMALSGGGVLEEWTVLSDTDRGVILRWGLSPGAAPLGLRVEMGGTTREWTLSPGGGVAAWLAPPGVEAPLPPDPAVQARRRASRGADLDGTALSIRAHEEGGVPPDDPGERAAAAVRALDDSSLGEGPEGEPAPPFLMGVEVSPDSGRPARVRELPGTALAEVALGALAVGRWSLARALLEELAGGDGSAPLPLLVAAAEWGMATGDARWLRSLRPALDGAAREVGAAVGRAPAPTAAFPSGSRALERLAEAVEPAGDREWTGWLREAARRAAPPVQRTLPVLGTPAPPAGAAAHDAVLPPLEGFAHPDDPGVLPRRTLHAARLLRSLVRGTLGITPDAAYGRLRLAPVLPARWTRVEVGGIRVGDTRLDLGYRREGDRHTFVLLPTAGRVPATVILEPLLPVGDIEHVKLEGEPVTVDSFREAGRTGIRFQFPLEGERSVTVVGRPRGDGEAET